MTILILSLSFFIVSFLHTKMYYVMSPLVFAYMLLHLSDLSNISHFVSHTFTRTARKREREEGVLSSQDCHLNYLTG